MVPVLLTVMSSESQARSLSPWLLTGGGDGAPCLTPNPATPVFGSTRGNRILDTRGKPFLPYGMTVFGLSESDWRAYVAGDRDQIRMAMDRWCTNFVRLQVYPPNLVSSGGETDGAFVAALRGEVNLALAHDNNVVISAQYENVSHQPAPTAATGAFWKVVAGYFGDDRRVAFSLFNEPSLGDGTPTVWQTWLDGAGRFLGMQQLAQDVRRWTNNLILVDGPKMASTLEMIPEYQIMGVPDLVYAIHPYGDSSAALWRARFGATALRFPVLPEEWGEWQSTATECYPNAPAVVPRFLGYLHAEGMGLGAWALAPGVFVTSSTTFTPTVMTSRYSCTEVAPELAEGAGAMVARYFYSNRAG